MSRPAPIPAVADAVREARADGRDVLLETECHPIVRALGIEVPAHLFVRDAGEASVASLDGLTGDRVVLKVVSAEIQHKSDVGGVEVVARDRDAVVAAVEAMERRFEDRNVAGYSINDFVEHDASLGNELLLGMRWTDDFGPVVTFGPGGVYAEFLSANLREGRDVAILHPTLTPADRLGAVVQAKAITPLVTGGVRSQKARIGQTALIDLLRRFLDFAAAHVPDDVAEFEINPVVLTGRGPVALDALLRLGGPRPAADPDRPTDKIGRLLEPRSIAIVGVSRDLNPGRIILNNVLREGFDRDRIYVVKPGLERLAGCRCVPDIASLPEPVDLIVLAIGAGQIPGTVEEIISRRKAESLIVIPGGLGERSGSEPLVRRMRDALHESRATNWRGPVINGGNCVGIASKPGRYDTIFIPEHKRALVPGEPHPVAILSQSGAFLLSKVSKLCGINPKYMISVGNQFDLTVGDYLAQLADDPGIDVFACYVEGFRPLDGRRWLEAASKIVQSGRSVILYRAGRTPLGAAASASHTAAIAGDYAVTRELARAAGVVVADTLADFEDLVMLFWALRGTRIDGWNLGAVSNAGFECVAFADSVERFRLRPFEDHTTSRLNGLLQHHRLHGIVEVRNPLDLTPMMNDEGYERAVRAVMDDHGVDAGIVGCVPLTGALNTLPEDDRHEEDLLGEDSIVSRMIRAHRECEKPWVAVVDGGALYDTMAQALTHAGVPTFRTTDRALRLFEIYCRSRIES